MQLSKLKEPRNLTKKQFLHLFLVQRTINFVVFTGTIMSSYKDIFWIIGPLGKKSIGY